ncbi:hypothetical protein N0V83_009306 [Neocucurbitaria cava]|uniref:CT20-domain-containing protein n=1 Tax=Neocucurbitaria cava TaxID=798079 RepID=A0A9W9CI21_9PLEO|nr:hypothetical protein N0V83_009306 [Neocucurbitaria cava]
MSSIHNDMRSHGFATEDAPHTRIPGIWKKLHQLYDLDTLDSRENEFAFSEDPDPVDPEEAATIPDFELPEDDYGELMWHKRFHSEGSASASSPPTIPTEDDKALYAPGIGLLKDLPESAARSRKAESAEDATPTPRNPKNMRASRASAKVGGKGTKTGTAASTAKNSKAQSTVSESAEEDEEDADEEESTAASEEDNAPSTRRTNRSRTKPAPKRTRKR